MQSEADQLMAEKSITWNGAGITARMRAAQVAGVNRTMGAAVNHARQNHNWQNRTGVLTGGIDIVGYAAPDENGVSGTWGVHDVEYALIHELGERSSPRTPSSLPSRYPMPRGRPDRRA
jgi:hypothetical protein